MSLYRHGRRRTLPPLLFGLGVLAHLVRRGRRYDIVHTASFPYFPVLAAGAARQRGRFRLLVDWHEVWTHDYWREYLGRVGGSIGWRIQRACLRVPQQAFCFSRLHERRLGALGLNGELTRLAAKIPPRQSATEVGLEKVDEAAIGVETSAAVSDETAATIRALREVVQQLPPEERVITRMRFWDGISVADIARALGQEQKPLYRKLESIQARLKTWLEERGIDRERAVEILAGETIW